MSETSGESLTLTSIQAKLEKAKGAGYWRSLDELTSVEGFREFLHREFPRQASEWIDDEGRRNFLKIMGASLALAGLSACTKQPTEYIMPYVDPPEQALPGKISLQLGYVGTRGMRLPVFLDANLVRGTSSDSSD